MTQHGLYLTVYPLSRHNADTFQCAVYLYQRCILYCDSPSTVQRTVFSVYCICTLLGLSQYTMHHSYMYNVVYTRQRTVLSVHCTLNNTVQCTLYTANFTLYSVHCTQNSTVHCKMYTVH